MRTRRDFPRAGWKWNDGLGILAGDGIHRVLPQVAYLGRLDHRLFIGLAEGRLVAPGGQVGVTDDHAGVLAQGLGLVFGHDDVVANHLEGVAADGILLFPTQALMDSPDHVGRQFGRRAADQLQEVLLQRLGIDFPGRLGDGPGGHNDLLGFLGNHE